MQTIKTAAIVVLMLTVLYGGYVSLTTPPEPLPDEIEEILVIEEAGGLGFGAGESLVSDLELGQPPAGILPQSPDASHDHNPGPKPATSSAEAFPSTGTFGSSFADLPPRASSDDGDMSGEDARAKKLPAIGSSTAAVTPRSADSYASTPSSFELPDPNAVTSTFDPSRGTPFESEGTTFNMSDESPTTAVDSVGATVPQSTQNRGLINAFATADAMYVKGQLKEALATLSVFYGMPNLSGSEKQQLLSRLDPLAREVIYSRRHLLEQPHRVSSSETLADIADELEVPVALLANINQLDNSVTALPGTELKVVRGPFRAEVDLTGKQLTLFLGDLYAGRFDIEVGNDPPPTPGTFTVQEKQTSRVFYDRSGVPVPAGSPNNPYGNMWLDLGGQISIHGSPNTVQPTKGGCISVAGDYADDIYGILSQGSSVTIRR